jgi:hypothetical protein
MAAKFTPIKVGEMESLLAHWGFRRITIEGTKELVWAKTRPEWKIQLRIFSGINPTGESRGCGEDAIRVEVYWVRSNGNPMRIGGSKRVNRTQGWRDNLKSRIKGWRDCLGPKGEIVKCPLCGAPMVLREIKNGKNTGRNFYGCVFFRENGCRGFRLQETVDAEAG